MVTTQLQKQKKVFMVVTIPTHLRVMMGVADLLRDSGRFQPVMVYYPSAVFDQDHAHCQRAPHDAWIWVGDQFVSKTAYLSGDWEPLPVRRRQRNGRFGRWQPEMGWGHWLDGFRLSSLRPKRGIYLRLVKALPFLPSPDAVTAGARWLIGRLVSVTRFVAGAYVLLRTALSDLVEREFQGRQEIDSYRNRTLLQKFLLRFFAVEWVKHSREVLGGEAASRNRLARLFNEGLLNGIGDQKRFDEGFRDLNAREQPSLVVLPEENLFYNSQFIVASAHSNGARAVVVPFTIVNTLEWAEAFYDVDLYQAGKGWNRVLAKAFPNWVLEHRGRRLILPPLFILGCECLGMTPANPWLISSGRAEALAAESQFMSEYYRNAGIPEKKIVLTGALSDDRLFFLLQNRNACLQALASRLGVDIGQKVVLIGLPPNQFGAGKREGCEFNTYEELVRHIVGTIVAVCAGVATVLINLHPRIDPASVAFLADMDATIVNEPIEDLVPLSDVYVAVASATIRIGISCGIPVINFDAYQYNYDDYKGLAGVLEIKSKSSFDEAVNSLVRDGDFYASVRAAQQDTANRLCLLDGKAGQRMLDLFERLTESPRLSDRDQDLSDELAIR